MKFSKVMLAAAMAFGVSTANATTKGLELKNRMTIINDGFPNFHQETRSYSFQVEVVSDDGRTKSEQWRDGRPFVVAEKDERYTIRLHNPLPVRVAVNLTLDGLNSITGKPSGISDGSKWVIEPYSSIEIRGWQVNQNESRRFFFTDKHTSYAEWRGEQLGKNLSVNCGVIGAAYFWNKRELQDYYDSHPAYVSTPSIRRCCKAVGFLDKLTGAEGRAQSKLALPLKEESKKDEAIGGKEKAGTGMGERESTPTTSVDFHYDAGMYKLADAVVIYYDFETPQHPNPFPGLSYAPEMPN